MSALPPRVERIDEKVERLLNLYEGPAAIADTVKAGDAAIPALESLLRGPSQSLHHSRCWAADALAAIGTDAAAQALVRALRDCATRVPEVMSREAEDVVVSTIADHLAGLSDPDAPNALLEALDKRAYPGCARALGRLGDLRATQVLVRSLMDDATRRAAKEALRQLGPATVPRLARLLSHPNIVNGTEPPSHIDGRVAAASLMGTLLPASAGIISDFERDSARRTLSAGLYDPQRGVRLAAALALARCSQGRAVSAVRVLVDALDDPDWRNTTSIVHALTRLGPQVEGQVLEAITPQGVTESVLRRQRRAIWIAGQLGTRAAITTLSSLIDNPNVQVRIAAVRALNSPPNSDYAPLYRYLDDPVPAVRRVALGTLCQRHAMSIERAVRLLGDTDEEIRRLSAARIGEDRKAALGLLVRTVFSLGKPLQGWCPRLRLTWYALRWLLAARHIRLPRAHA